MATINEIAKALAAATFETTIAKEKTFQLKLEDFPIEAVVALMQYGVGRKFNDAVGGADKDAATKVELAGKMIEDWKQGKIGRQAAAGVTDEIKVRRSLIADALRAAGKWDEVKDLEPSVRNERLDAIFDKQGEDKQKAIMTAVAREIERRKAKPSIDVEI